MRKRRSLSALLPLVLIPTVLDVAGCRSSRPAESGKGPDGAGGTRSTLLSSHDQDMRAKLKPIIRCLNGPMSWYENMRAYHDRVRALAGNNPPSMAPLRDTYFNANDLEVSDGTTSCANELDMGASLPPATPDLDAAARTAATAMRSLAGPGHQMDTYLKQSDYLQDHFSRGKQLDAIISPLLTTTLAASKQIRVALERENGAIRQHELEAIDKREGHSLRWHTQRCMIAARALDENLRRLNREGQLNAASAQTAVQPLKASIAEAQAYVAAHPDEAKEVPNGNRPLWFSVDDGLSQELSSGQQLVDLLAHPERQDSMFPQTPEQQQEGHRKEINDQVDLINRNFNFLIERYNDAVRYTG